MHSRKILIFGRMGQVGGELCHTLAGVGEVTALDYPEVDFTRPESIVATVRAVRPEVIVNAAAYTAVDRAEAEPELAMKINGQAPAILAAEAKRAGSLLVHYSTDYVFDGSKRGAYLETDEPNPLNAYGRSKLAGDRAVQSAGGDYLILRTSWVYGARGSNFLHTMLRLARERSELRIVDDQLGAPTSSDSIAQATADLLTKMLSPSCADRVECSGTYNLTNAGVTSWFGFAQALLVRAEASLGVRMPKLVPIASSEYPLPARRPANSCLSNEKIGQVFGIHLAPWEQALSMVMDRLATDAGGCAARAAQV